MQPPPLPTGSTSRNWGLAITAIVATLAAWAWFVIHPNMATFGPEGLRTKIGANWIWEMQRLKYVDSPGFSTEIDHFELAMRLIGSGAFGLVVFFYAIQTARIRNIFGTAIKWVMLVLFFLFIAMASSVVRQLSGDMRSPSTRSRSAPIAVEPSPEPKVQDVAPSEPPAATVPVVSEYERQMNESMARAQALWPAAFVPGEPLHDAILKRKQQLEAEGSNVFEDPRWPERITMTVADEMKIKPVK